MKLRDVWQRAHSSPNSPRWMSRDRGRVHALPSAARFAPQPAERAHGEPAVEVVERQPSQGAEQAARGPGLEGRFECAAHERRIAIERGGELGHQRAALVDALTDRELESVPAARDAHVEVAAHQAAQADQQHGPVAEADEPVEAPAGMDRHQHREREPRHRMDAHPRTERPGPGEPLDAAAERVEPHEEEQREPEDAEALPDRPGGAQQGVKRRADPVGDRGRVVRDPPCGQCERDREQDDQRHAVRRQGPSCRPRLHGVRSEVLGRRDDGHRVLLVGVGPRRTRTSQVQEMREIRTTGGGQASCRRRTRSPMPSYPRASVRFRVGRPSEIQPGVQRSCHSVTAA